jgi:cell division protein FtsQ
MPKWWRITLVTVLCGAIFGSVVGGTTWLWRSGRVGTAIADFKRNILVRSAEAGFVVEDVVLEGRVNAALRDVIAAVDLRRGDSMFGFDPDAVQKRVTALPWVRHATVERRLPDTVRIRIAERRPAALWQRQGQLSLIDEDGTVITTRGLGRFRDLIIIVGNDAPKHVPTLVALLRSEPALGRRVSAAVRVGGRRWNVKLRNSIAVWLPEDDPLGAWRRLAELNLRHRILERDIKVIDLRLPDRMVVRPGKKRRAVISKVGGKRT